MKIAITGANGYIGSNLVKECIKNGHEVIAVDFYDDNIDKKATYIKSNIFECDKDFFYKLSCPDVLIHLAWRNGFNHNNESHVNDLSKHYHFLKNMIESGVKYLSVMGTVHEIGYYEGKIDENVPCNPMSLYGIAKNALRQMIELLIKDTNIYFHWLRAFYIIGDDLKSNSVFGKLLNSAKEGKKEFPLNSGKNKYDFINVQDLSCQILSASIQSEINGIINVCSGEPISLGEKIEQFIKCKNLDIKVYYNVFPDRAYDSPIIYGDNYKIKKIMGRND